MDSRTDKRNIKIQTILSLKQDAKATLREIFFDMMDQVRVMTDVKNFIDMEGLKYFVDYVIEEHPDLTVGDIQVYCRRIITGAHGHSYENISVQKLIIWLNEYRDYRAVQTYRIKREIEKKEREIDDGKIYRPGLLRMAEIFDRVNKKRLKEIAESEVSRNRSKYRDIWDYLQRNGIDSDKFLSEFMDRHARILRAKGYDPEKLESILFEKIILNELRLFVIDENNKLARAGISAV